MLVENSKSEHTIVDTYSITAATIDRTLLGKGSKLLDGESNKPFWRKWWWYYLIAPIIAALISLGVYLWSFSGTSVVWLAIVTGELLAVIFSSARIAFETFILKRNFLLYLLSTLAIIVVVFWPSAIAQSFSATTANQSQPMISILCLIAIGFICLSLSASTVNITLLIETLKSTFKDFSSTYRATVGQPANRAIMVALRVVLRATRNGEEAKELEYLRTTAQAMIDSAGTRILPWLALLTITSLGFESFFEKALISDISLLNSDVINVSFPAIRFGIAVGILYITFLAAHRTYIDVAILQAISKIQQKPSVLPATSGGEQETNTLS